MLKTCLKLALLLALLSVLPSQTPAQEGRRFGARLVSYEEVPTLSTAGEFAELLAAIRAGYVYANVHSALFPGGEIRGQLSAGAKPVQ
jgi:CHRD domain-containing protein